MKRPPMLLPEGESWVLDCEKCGKVAGASVLKEPWLFLATDEPRKTTSEEVRTGDRCKCWEDR